ncbi:Metalloendopeptidase [Aphelenchoides bicaudatus]|nr:Metalloendopeptidase [Aphelenchoides bicaudatus]
MRFFEFLMTQTFRQFFCGFLACYWRQLTDGNSNRKHTLKANRRNRANEYVQLVCLVVPLVFNFGETSIFNRKIALFVVTLILGQQKENTLLANKLLVKIGNWSYSIYLIHWPLFTLHRFIFADLYQNEAEPEFFVGFLLISISLFLGWITESTFDAVSKCICTWTWLLLVLVLGFLFNLFLLNQLKHNAADIFTEAKPSNEWKIQFRQQLHAIQANQNQTLPINKLIELNANMIRYSMTFSECGDESDALPSHFKMNITYMQYICHEKGAGTKNMLLVGNSHAAFNFPGIKHVFKDVYKTLTVIGRDSCYPAPVEFQQKHTAQTIKNYCVNLMLKELYSRTKDVPINGDIKKDPLFKSMQNFYKRLSKIPKQVMFIQNQHMSFEQKPARKLVNRLKFGKPAGQIGNSLQYQLSQYSQINQRIKAVNCGKKCLKLDWTKIWCSSKDFCSAIDSTKKISYFIDENHPSWFGSIRQAKYMRQLYDYFVKNTTKE